MRHPNWRKKLTGLDLQSPRSQHIIFLLHVWLLAPFMVWWLLDQHVRKILGAPTVQNLVPCMVAIMLYLGVRTWLAFRGNEKIPWGYLFPPIDVVVISTILAISHRGPMSNLTLLFFLPIIQAAGTLNVRWAGMVGLMVIAGTSFSAVGAVTDFDLPVTNWKDLLRAEPLNVAFRLYFLIIVSSLMTYQAQIAAAMQTRLKIVAERQRLAAEMHDGVQGHLVATSSMLELIERLAHRDPDRVVELAREAREQSRSAASELRFLVRRMKSSALKGGFIVAMQTYFESLSSLGLVSIKFVHEKLPEISPDQEQGIFRICQELVTNALKHAEATVINLTLMGQSSEIVIEVQDDGKGTNQIPESALARVTELNGTLVMLEQDTPGTYFQAKIPLKL